MGRNTVPRIASAWLGFVVATSFAATIPANAFEKFDFDQRYFIEPGFIVKDHAVIKATDGTIHLFYIRADESVPVNETAKSLGHATTTDFFLELESGAEGLANAV